MSAANYLGMWTPTAATWVVSGNYYLLTRTGANPLITGPSGRAYPGIKTFLVRARVRKTVGGLPSDGWVGRVTYVNGSHGFSNSFCKVLDAPIEGANEWIILEWDMSALTVGAATDWTAGVIDQVRIELDNDTGSAWEVDYITFGGRGFGRNLGEVGKHDRAKATLNKTAAIGNRVLDDLIQDADYWALDTGTGLTWTINTTDADVTGSGTGQLQLPAAFKSPTGNGTKTQATSAARVALGRNNLANVRAGEAFLVSGRVSVEPTFTGMPQLTVLFYKVDGTTLANGGLGFALTKNDYRNGAPGGANNTVFDIATVIRAPADAVYARLACAVDWPDSGNSQNAAGFCYWALPYEGDGQAFASRGTEVSVATQTATNTVGVWTTVGSTVVISSEKLLVLDGVLWVKSSTNAAKNFSWRWRVVCGGATTTITSTGWTTPAASGSVSAPGDMKNFLPSLGQGTCQVFLEVSPDETADGNLQVTRMVMIAEDDRTDS